MGSKHSEQDSPSIASFQTCSSNYKYSKTTFKTSSKSRSISNGKVYPATTSTEEVVGEKTNVLNSIGRDDHEHVKATPKMRNKNIKLSSPASPSTLPLSVPLLTNMEQDTSRKKDDLVDRLKSMDIKPYYKHEKQKHYQVKEHDDCDNRSWSSSSTDDSGTTTTRRRRKWYRHKRKQSKRTKKKDQIIQVREFIIILPPSLQQMDSDINNQKKATHTPQVGEQRINDYYIGDDVNHTSNTRNNNLNDRIDCHDCDVSSLHTMHFSSSADGVGEDIPDDNDESSSSSSSCSTFSKDSDNFIDDYDI